MLFAQGQAQAQEIEPLAMKIVLQWTVAGAVVGVGLGAALWLIDPDWDSVQQRLEPIQRWLYQEI